MSLKIKAIARGPFKYLFSKKYVGSREGFFTVLVNAFNNDVLDHGYKTAHGHRVEVVAGKTEA